MTDARTVHAALEAYAAKELPDHVEVVSFGDTAATFAPEAIAALRAVLDELDFLDNVDLFAGPIHRLRTVIETALEAS